MATSCAAAKRMSPFLGRARCGLDVVHRDFEADLIGAQAPSRAVVRALADDSANVLMALLSQGSALALREGTKGCTRGRMRSKGNAGGGSAMGLGVFILSC